MGHPLKEALVVEGHISAEMMEAALRRRELTRQPLMDCLVQVGADEARVLHQVAAAMSLQYISTRTYRVLSLTSDRFT